MGSARFIDEAEITVSGGAGGSGIASFYRTRNRPKGIPDGGHGGRGANVYAISTRNSNTLITYVNKKNFRASDGQRGGSRDCHGADAPDLYLPVPIGTKILDADTNLLHAELAADSETSLLARGGAGGLGNAYFKTSTNRFPRTFTEGEAGDHRTFRLELTLLSDVGLLGLPNSGKSTFLNQVSRANVKTGNYPFTTLEPMLGTVSNVIGEQIKIADIPGLLEGASQGVGLGAQFLRHVSRTTILLHLIDASGENWRSSVIDDFNLIQYELSEWQRGTLLEKERWIILNKSDTQPIDEQRDIMRHICELHPNRRVYFISSLTGEGVEAVLSALFQFFGKS